MYWNLDFDADPGFSAYVVLLVISGLIMLFLGISGVGEQTKGERAVSAVVGLAFFGYGFYLALLFDGGTYWIVFKAFIVPAVLIFNVIRNAITRRKERKAGPVEAQANPYPAYPPQANAAQPYAPQPAAPQAYAPQPAAPQPYAPQPAAPQAAQPAPVSPVQEQ
ncbi:putative lipid-binding transport protein (Tim44 family) [Allocatelliglobosispora scoriae]|uniref:Putative lipid-binding transport protein (Tim44 family) n=1 Tax=Allocatelliglobosispora scoriae TaxID=643052 RepID=A0A841BX53_9ACTN|nr:hypothetical protein [Allocatelliglobosispora scoriae]MBB5871310.1 putative lipid-binding transport protein (Tim44 family) [Allocatelliglobosispora scoriae]